jgi:nucleoside-diphosphate-sugar epimerase
MFVERMDVREITPDWINKSEIDTVFDLCGLSNDASAEINPDLTKDINLFGAKNLADCAKRAGVKRYIYSSSCSVYGHGDKGGLTEEDECHPQTLYAECKVRVEDHLRKIADKDFRPVILRNATVFGVAPRMRFDLAVNVMTLRAWRDGVILVMGGGDQYRPFVHVSAVVDAFCHALTLENETVNVGHNRNNHTISELARMVKANIPSARIENIPDFPDRRNYNVSFDKLHDMGAATPYPVDRGIKEVLVALMNGEITDDPTTNTLQYYKSLIDWNERIEKVRLNGRIL